MMMMRDVEDRHASSGPQTMSPGVQVQTVNACLLETDCGFDFDGVLQAMMMTMMMMRMTRTTHDHAQNSKLEERCSWHFDQGIQHVGLGLGLGRLGLGLGLGMIRAIE